MPLQIVINSHVQVAPGEWVRFVSQQTTNDWKDALEAHMLEVGARWAEFPCIKEGEEVLLFSSFSLKLVPTARSYPVPFFTRKSLPSVEDSDRTDDKKRRQRGKRRH
jgi:hypothetical protein